MDWLQNRRRDEEEATQQQHQSWPRVLTQQGAMEEGDTRAGKQAGMREMEAAWEYQEMPRMYRTAHHCAEHLFNSSTPILTDDYD